MSEPALADDMLEGARAIAEFIYGTGANPRKAYRAIEVGRLPIFRIWNRLCARKSAILDWIKRQERASVTGLSR